LGLGLGLGSVLGSGLGLGFVTSLSGLKSTVMSGIYAQSLVIALFRWLN